MNGFYKDIVKVADKIQYKDYGPTYIWYVNFVPA